eukprot:Lithocolla_globosa_v1_NODE_7491_length_940_cov_4.984181.p1 type:complete len:207 gc:universal NODE_7491_length_940_cov_4.984181:230-850(+)
MKFDVKRSSGLLERYWDFRKNTLKITKRTLTIDDVDKKILQSGVFVKLEGCKDKNGCQVLLAKPGELRPNEWGVEEIVKSIYFLMEMVSDDENVQKRGITIIDDLSTVGPHMMNRKLISTMFDNLQNRMPVRIARLCIIDQPAFFNVIWGVVRLFIKPKLKSRIKVIGTDRPLLFDIIPKESVPENYGGTKTFSIEEWIGEICNEN